MSKFVETEYGSTKEILKFPDHYVALAVMVDGYRRNGRKWQKDSSGRALLSAAKKTLF